ncbi:hypothetical protein [Coleofasciculus sp. E1-EBD-02]
MSMPLKALIAKGLEVVQQVQIRRLSSEQDARTTSIAYCLLPIA